MSTLSLTQSTPAGRAASLLAAVYGQYVPELTVSQGDKVRDIAPLFLALAHSLHPLQLALTTSSGEVSSLPEVATALFEAGGKSNDALGASEEDKSAVKQWLGRIGEGQFEKEDGVKVRFPVERRTCCFGLDAADESLENADSGWRAQ